MNYVQVTEIEIDPAQLENYKAPVSGRIEMARQACCLIRPS